jgi:hypothetical protein
LPEWKGRGDQLERGRKELSRMMKIFSILIEVWITKICLFVKIHQIVHLEFVHFSICKFYLKKKNYSQAWWCISIISAPRRQRQEDREFKTRLGYIAKPCLI